MQRSHFLAALVAIAIVATPSLVQAQTNGTWNTVISPSAGGTKTSISFYATGNFLTGYSNTGVGPGQIGQGIGFTGVGTAPSNAWTMATTNFSFAPFGYITNLTQGVSRSLNSIGFYSFGVGAGQFTIFYSSELPAETGDTLAWVLDATPTELEIDLAFSNFTQGTYNAAQPYGLPGQYNMEIIPEPSTYALLALSAAGLGGYVLRRRRK